MVDNIQKISHKGNNKQKNNGMSPQRTKPNRLLKKNMLYYRSNRIFNNLKGHLICLNKILHYPFEGVNPRCSYFISDSELVKKLIDILKIFGYTKITYSEECMCFDLSTPEIISHEAIRYNEYYGYITPQPIMLGIRESNKKLINLDENLVAIHLKCIKKILKNLEDAEMHRPIKYYIPSSPEMPEHSNITTLVAEKLEKFEYSISIEENAIKINL